VSGATSTSSSARRAAARNATITTVAALSWVDGTVGPGTTYRIACAAGDAPAVGDASPIASVTTVAAAPGPRPAVGRRDHRDRHLGRGVRRDELRPGAHGPGRQHVDLGPHRDDSRRFRARREHDLLVPRPRLEQRRRRQVSSCSATTLPAAPGGLILGHHGIERDAHLDHASRGAEHVHRRTLPPARCFTAISRASRRPRSPTPPCPRTPLTATASARRTCPAPASDPARPVPRRCPALQELRRSRR
jgi:hypothetical protein